MQRIGNIVRDAIAASVEALANPGVRGAQTAWTLGFAADAALIVVMMVSVFRASGPEGVALLGAARMLPSTVAGVLASVPLLRLGPARLLVGLNASRSLAAVGGLVAIASGAPAIWLYLVMAVIGAADAMVRPSQHSLLPALVRTPGELVTANVASSTGEAIGTFTGPLIAALCISTGAPAAAAGFAVGAYALAALALGKLQFEDVADVRGAARTPSGGPLGIGTGLAAIRRRPAVGLVIVGFALQTLVRGLLVTLIVVVSTSLIGLGEAGVGILSAAIGVGGVAGLVGGLALRRSSPAGYTVALAAWGLPIAVIGIAPGVGVAVAALVAVGLANALLDIVGFTLLQRGTRNEERGAVFAIFEGAAGLGATIGSLAAPPLILLLGLRPALVATGLVLPIAAVVIRLLLGRVGGIEVVSAAAIERLRHVDAFRVLPMTALERLALSAVPVQFRAGDVIMRKGEPGDRFIVIDSGSIRITDDGRLLDTLGPGSSVGEIALLRGTPRTATVTAATDVSGSSFDAAAFLLAVSGPAASAATAKVMSDRLARSAAET